jgi:hypothetical protein
MAIGDKRATKCGAQPILKPANDRLQLPYAQATLADHLEFRRKLERDRSHCSPAMRAFLECDEEEIVEQKRMFPLYDLPNLHQALRIACKSWKLTSELGLTSGRSGGVAPPNYRHLRIRPTKRRLFLSEGVQFFCLAGGERRIVSFSEVDTPRGAHIEFTLIGHRSRRREIAADFNRIVRWTNRHHYLRKQAIRPNGALLVKRERTTWDRIALPSETKELLQRNILGLIKQRDLFRRNHVPQQRGILLHGAPGTGKTMIGKALADWGIATFIWVTAADIDYEPSCVRNIFRLARRLRPTVLFLEDLDFYGANRSQFGRKSVLGELLTQMDGFERNDGLIIVATTNELAAIEPAIKDRPSRFDVVLEIGLPRVEARRQILEQQLRHVVVDAHLLDAAAIATDGLSGAQVREVSILTLQEAIYRGAVDDDGIARPTGDDMRAALAKVTGATRRPIGFA